LSKCKGRQAPHRGSREEKVLEGRNEVDGKKRKAAQRCSRTRVRRKAIPSASKKLPDEQHQNKESSTTTCGQSKESGRGSLWREGEGVFDAAFGRALGAS